MREILDRFAHAEFQAEWDEPTARLGDAATAAMMERTAAQRRADAVAAIFERAATASPGVVGPEPVVSIVIDEATWEAHLARSLGREDLPTPDAATVAERRWSATSGAS